MKISYRQMSVLILLAFITLKFSALPSLMYTVSGNMSWLTALMLMIIDSIYVFIIVGLMKKSGEKNIYEFMTACLGKFLTRVILFILILKYALVVANVSKGMEIFVIENLYSEFHWLIFSIPLVILVAFMVYKGIRNIGRVGELVYIPVILGCAYIMIKAFSGVHLQSAFLPMFEYGARPIFDSAFTYVSWFGSGTFLLMLFGKVNFSDKKKFTIFNHLFFAILLVQLMYLIFYGLFQITSPTHAFCLSDISQFSGGDSSISELSWLVVSLWIVAQTVQLALYSFALTKAIKYMFNIKNDIVPILLVLVFIFTWSYIGKITVRLEEIFYNPISSIITISGAYIVPIIICLGYFVHNRKVKKQKLRVNGDEKVKNNI